MKRRRLVLVLVIAALSAFPVVSFARSDNAEAKRLPGFIDGSAFSELAGEDSEIVEIALGPSILGAISRGAAKDPDSKSVLEGLHSVNAYIVNLKKDSDRTERAAKLVQEMEAQLDRRGWERIARIREKSQRVNVFTLSPDGIVQGLVVLVFNGDEGQVVFANLAGSIDLAKIGQIGDTLHVPGLDKVKRDKVMERDSKHSRKPAPEEEEEEEEQP